MLFLVTGNVHKTEYEGDSSASIETRLVEADNENYAYNKFRKYFEDQTSEYRCYYSVSNIIVHEIIK